MLRTVGLLLSLTVALTSCVRSGPPGLVKLELPIIHLSGEWDLRPPSAWVTSSLAHWWCPFAVAPA